MAYGDFKDLTRRTSSGKILREKAYNIARNLKYDSYQHGLASMVYKFSDKKSFDSVIKNKNMSDQCPSHLVGVGRSLTIHDNYQENYTNQLLENVKK